MSRPKMGTADSSAPPRPCETNHGESGGTHPPIHLQPFSGPEFTAGLEIRCAVTLLRDALREILLVSWELAGSLSEVAIPRAANSPKRETGLWESTCFELFLARRNSPQYWEFNLSPSGDWNAWRFEKYRQGMREEQAFSLLRSTVVRGGAGAILATLEIEPGKILPEASELDAGITAVIQGRSGELSYWALAHCAPKPDFHRRDSFVMRIGRTPVTRR